MNTERSVDRLRNQWGGIASKIPEELLKGNYKILHGYYRAQLRISCEKKVKARNILNSLASNKNFISLEDSHADLLVAIDIAVKGYTNYRDFRNEPVKPLFTFDGN